MGADSSLSDSLCKGITRDCAFLMQKDRHFHVLADVVSTMATIEGKKKPKWFSDVEKWRKTVAVEAKEALVKKQPCLFGCYLAFIFLPTGFAVCSNAAEVPEWNVWSEAVVAKFFETLTYCVDDSGFAVVLHSGSIEHMAVIRKAASTRGFTHSRKFVVRFDSPLYDRVLNIEVFNFVLDVLCRATVPTKYPFDGFKAIHSSLDPTSSDTLLMDSDLAIVSAPIFNTSLSIGFCQMIIELCTSEKQVVYHFNSGQGAAFLAGDLSGRHVICLDSRKDCIPAILKGLSLVHRRNGHREKIPEIVVVEDEDPLNFDAVTDAPLLPDITNLESEEESDEEGDDQKSRNSRLRELTGSFRS